jgi:hypothetical protein
MSPVGKLLAERNLRRASVKHVDDHAERVQIADALLLLALENKNHLAFRLHELLGKGRTVTFSMNP